MRGGGCGCGGGVEVLGGEGDGDLARVDGDAFGAVVSLVDPYEAVGQLKHVVPERDDDELGILCSLLKKTKTRKICELYGKMHRDVKPYVIG